MVLPSISTPRKPSIETVFSRTVPGENGQTKGETFMLATHDNSTFEHVPHSDPAVGGIAADRLRSIIERVERLEEERKALAGDIKDIFGEAKSAGFDVKVIRQIIKLRKMEPAQVEEQETLLDIYRRALGM